MDLKECSGFILNQNILKKCLKINPLHSFRYINKIQFKESEIIEKEGKTEKRYPNLNTVLMVENFLKNNRDIPLKISEIKKKLPKKIMHQTLIIILEYLWKSGKIIYGPKGVQWIYSEPEHLKKMFENSLEV